MKSYMVSTVYHLNGIKNERGIAIANSVNAIIRERGLSGNLRAILSVLEAYPEAAMYKVSID